MHTGLRPQSLPSPGTPALGSLPQQHTVSVAPAHSGAGPPPAWLPSCPAPSSLSTGGFHQDQSPLGQIKDPRKPCTGVSRLPIPWLSVLFPLHEQSQWQACVSKHEPGSRESGSTSVQ